jgi:site-specific DNA recombinase
MKMNVAYLRVSTESQTEKYGLDVQREKILDYCDKKGVVIDEWYVDGGYSGSKLERPEISRLLANAKDGMIDTVYVYKLDRMSRDVIDTLNLMYNVLPSYGVKVISMTEEIRTENPMDKVMLTMNAAMNQYEREVIRMRMSAGMVERVKKGYWMGGGRIPFGYYYDRNDGILHPKEDEAEIVRQAYKLYIDGYSCEKISQMLGFKGERIVIQILKRKSNIGMIEYKGAVYQGLHEPIVDEDVFYKAQECIKKRSNNSYVTHDNMLSGLCWCGVCGARMRYQKWGKYYKLVCYSHYKSTKKALRKSDNCKNPIVMAKVIEDEVQKCFIDFSINLSNESFSEENNTTVIENAIKKSNSKIKRMYEMYLDNLSENLMEMIREEERNVEELKNQLIMEMRKENIDNSEKVEEIKKIADVWRLLTNQAKNKVLKECVEKIVITGDNIEIRFITF